MEASNYLFVYGTLLCEGNEFAVLMMDNSSFYSNAKFNGKLYDIGEYPGAIFQPDSDSYVCGQILLMNNPEIVLKRLDGYEGFVEDGPQPNEFTRELVAIETDNEPLKCWVYLYNLPVDSLWQIKSGDYLEYLKVWSICSRFRRKTIGLQRLTKFLKLRKSALNPLSVSSQTTV